MVTVERELPILMEKFIPRCYFPKHINIKFKQLHGFCDASEQAYAGVVYLRMVDTKGDVHTSLVPAKTRVASIKRLSIPRLELCGAQLLAQILHHCQIVLNLPTKDIFAWTDTSSIHMWEIESHISFSSLLLIVGIMLKANNPWIIAIRIAFSSVMVGRTGLAMIGHPSLA